MNEEKRKVNFERLQQMFPGKIFLNKGEMLLVINRSYATAKRRAESNIKYDVPESTHSVEFKRTTSTYIRYQYSLDDLAIFLSDRNYYWEMIRKRIDEKSI